MTWTIWVQSQKARPSFPVSLEVCYDRQCQRDSSPQYENAVIVYSPSCYSKPSGFSMAALFSLWVVCTFYLYKLYLYKLYLYNLVWILRCCAVEAHTVLNEVSAQAWLILRRRMIFATSHLFSSRWSETSFVDVVYLTEEKQTII